MPFQRLLELGRDFVDSCARDRHLMETLRTLLVQETVPALRVLSVVTAVAVFLALPAIVRHVRRVPFGLMCMALLVMNGALMIRLWWMPAMPQVYFDEMLFLNTAETMARHGMHALTTFDDKPPGVSCHACPGGWQYLVSLVYGVMGVHVDLAFVLAACLSAFTVLLLFGATWEMFTNGRVALLSALFLAVLPIHVRLAGSAALETSSLFFLVAAVASLMAWVRGGERPLLLLGACCLGWFANVRMESPVVLMPLVGLLVLVMTPSERIRGWGNALTLLAAFVIIILSTVPSLLADFYGLANHTFVYYQSLEQSRAQVRSNMGGNALYWVSDRIHPLPLTVFALLGLAWCRREDRRLAWAWLAWFVVVLAFYTMNPSCDFSLRFTLDSWRNALHPSLGVVILAALGADAILTRMSRPAARNGMAALVLVTCLSVPWLYREFVLGRHVWMMNWAALTAMQPRVDPRAWLLVADREMAYGPNGVSIAYELACTTGVRPRFFLLPEDYMGEPGQPRPQVVVDVDLWTRDRTRPILLYHVHTGTEAEAYLFSVMRSLLDLEPLAGQAMRRSRHTFSLWRVKGVAPVEPGGTKETSVPARSHGAGIP